MLKHRLILGTVLVAALIGALWLDAAFAGGWIVLGALVLLATLGGWELAPLLSRTGLRVGRTMTIASGLLGLGSMAALAPPMSSGGGAAASGSADLAVWGVAVATGLGLVWGARTKDPASAVHAAVSACFSAVYLGVFPASMLLIRAEFGAMVLLGAIGVIKACDIGAYFTGRSVGKRKLIAWLSPGKTWEGLVGGLALAAGTAAILSIWTSWIGWVEAAIVGAGLGLAGQAGDLFESALKRTAAVKDSGAVPGFGGVLDLVDSPLVGAPAALWLLRALASSS